MKRYIFAMMAVAASFSQAKAQFYIKAGVGYAFPTAGQTIGPDGPYNGTRTYLSPTGAGINFKVKSASLASGVQGLIAGGYMLNKNIGVELGLNVGIANTKYTSETIFQENSSSVTIHASTPTMLTPSLLLQTDAGKLDLYMRSGIAVPVVTNVIANEMASDPSGTATLEYKYSTKFKPGFTGAVGIKYPLTDYMNLWVEGSLLSMSLYAEEAEVTSYEVNSRDYLGFLLPEEKLIRFENNGNSRNDAPTFSMPFSSIGINAGVSFHF